MMPRSMAPASRNWTAFDSEGGGQERGEKEEREAQEASRQAGKGGGPPITAGCSTKGETCSENQWQAGREAALHEDIRLMPGGETPKCPAGGLLLIP